MPYSSSSTLVQPFAEGSLAEIASTSSLISELSSGASSGVLLPAISPTTNVDRTVDFEQAKPDESRRAQSHASLGNDSGSRNETQASGEMRRSSTGILRRFSLGNRNRKSNGGVTFKNRVSSITPPAATGSMRRRRSAIVDIETKRQLHNQDELFVHPEVQMIEQMVASFDRTADRHGMGRHENRSKLGFVSHLGCTVPAGFWVLNNSRNRLLQP